MAQAIKTRHGTAKEHPMTVNEGTIDRVLRVIVGLGLIALALGYIPGMAATPLGWIGVVPLVTGLVGWCPAYSIFGISTCRRA